ncbi:MAG: glycosyltransferase family 4 protein [Flavobacteriales bacterium]|nr:glycosyltransferase family 4 protein [Flavobacteriales bacterium]
MNDRSTRTGRRRILYCHPKRSSFIQRDIEGLGRQYEVQVHELGADNGWKLPFRLLLQFVWLIKNRAWSRDCICHFSGYHALLPALLCRRTFIILAGSDCASIPSIGYGNHARLLFGWATRRAVAWATLALPVYKGLMRREQSYSSAVPKEQGILAFGPRIRTPWIEVPYGFDPEQWSPGATDTRDAALFICVPGPATPSNRVHRLKGVDLVLAIARRLPHARFVIAGLNDPTAYTEVPANMTLVGHLNAGQLRELYRSASFHLQLSLSEGMPNALCEAMLCGCIPLVSDISSMPGIVDGIGMVLMRDDPALGAAMCERSLALTPEERHTRSLAARDRIVKEFPMEQRMDTLTRLLEHEGPFHQQGQLST